MKNRAASLYLFLFTFIFLHTFQSIAQEPYVNSLFSDRRARGIGDILTVLIIESSSAKSEANSATNKKSDHNISTTGGSKSSSYMPLYGLGGKVENGFDNDAETSRTGTLKGKITVTITEVAENGNFVISGEREMAVNGETEKTLITGIIRPEDINSNNTIYSFNVANAKIKYLGKGLVNKGQSPGLLDRILGWIF